MYGAKKSSYKGGKAKAVTTTSTSTNYGTPTVPQDKKFTATHGKRGKVVC